MRVNAINERFREAGPAQIHDDPKTDLRLGKIEATMFYRDERLALFIDGSNLYAATKALGFDIDYKLLRSEFMRRGKMVRAVLLHGPDRERRILSNPPACGLARLQRLYAGDQAGEGVHRLDGPAQDQGQYGHRAGRRCDGGWPTMWRHIVLFSGDGDFRPLVEALSEEGGVRVSVVSDDPLEPRR